MKARIRAAGLWVTICAGPACTTPAGVTGPALERAPSSQNEVPAAAGAAAAEGTVGSAAEGAAPGVTATASPWVSQPSATTVPAPTSQAPNEVANQAVSAPVASSPNVPTAAVPPAHATLPPKWAQYRYAFYDRVLASLGSAQGQSLEIYLTDDANFCVQEPNVGLVGGVLDEGQKIYALHWNAAIREPQPGDYTGPADYNSKYIFAGQIARASSDLGLSPNSCAVVSAGVPYQGNVTVLSDDANGVAFAISGVDEASLSLAASTPPQPISTTLTARACKASYPVYAAESQGTPTFGPYFVWQREYGIFQAGPCVWQSKSP